MEAIIGIVGVLVGWILAEVSDWRRQVRAGRAAARVIAVELKEARALLEVPIERDGLLPRVPGTAAWMAHAMPLLQWKPLSADPVMMAYSSIETDVAMLQWFEAERTTVLSTRAELADTYAGQTADVSDFAGRRAALLARKFSDNQEQRTAYLEEMRNSTLPQIDHAVQALHRLTT